MSTVEFLLSPLMYLMQVALEVLHGGVGNYGFAIVLLSLVVRLITIPITRVATTMEEKERLKQQEMAPALAAAKADFKGRERFERIEEIYKAHDYHPIMSLSSIVPLLFQIPFLLSALFLLVSYPPLLGEPFGVIPDLSQPDRLWVLGSDLSINIVPLVLTAVALLDSILKPGATRQSQMRFLIVSLVLVALIYSLPAGVCLYWLSSNVWSLLASLYKRAQLALRAQ